MEAELPPQNAIDSVNGYIHRNPASVDHLLEYPTFDGYGPVRTLYENFKRGCELFHQCSCLGTRRYMEDGTRGPYEWMTFKEVKETTEKFSSGLLNLGLKAGDKLGMFSINRWEVIISDLSCYSNSFVTVSLYDTLGEDSVEYVINHAEVTAVIVSRDKIPEILKVANNCPSLKFIIQMEDWNLHALRGPKYKVEELGDVERQRMIKNCNAEIVEYSDVLEKGLANPMEGQRPKPTDLVSILYTSGTTGYPKGVLLTHGNMVAAIGGCFQVVPTYPTDVYLSYLPLAHVYERLMTSLSFSSGGCVGFYQGDVKKLVDDIQELKPTLLIGVPRVYHRIYDKILQQVNESFILKKQLFYYAFRTKLEAMQQGQETPYLDAIVFSKIKEKLGGRVRLIVSGSAPLSPTLHDFLKVCFGCPVIQGYGLSETASGGSVSPHDSTTNGHVGYPIVCSEIKLISIDEMDYRVTDKPCPRGEIAIRGPNVFQGYYKNPEKTKEVFTEDGFFLTGDVGRWNTDGTLSIIDRKKNIFKLSQGEYVAAEKLEGVFLQSPYIAQIFVFGDSYQSYLVAIIVPDADNLQLWASKNLPDKNLSMVELCNDARVRQLITGELLDKANSAKLRGFEFIKQFHLHPEEWTPENALVTPTFKLKRPVLQKYFQTQIDQMYSDNPQIDPIT
eukprot:CAMPEP_0174254172 /NCGR_PEP_ID=MMETSP0439-20130205/3517_1 /TAXON_ID=0 /ORGANISM="Stereomyxa ramosa, Strain Chinc5" /LENGTH=671 /DNA_ID=CAMNT_0015335623 /DNA_START=35 /DNA_END=2047 /DNA_ORIENTATION=-